jgi:hypothetical protein
VWLLYPVPLAKAGVCVSTSLVNSSQRALSKVLAAQGGTGLYMFMCLLMISPIQHSGAYSGNLVKAQTSIMKVSAQPVVELQQSGFISSSNKS